MEDGEPGEGVGGRSPNAGYLVLQCPLLSPLELVYRPWRISCISMGAGAPILAVHALSTKLDGITSFTSLVLLESRCECRAQCRFPGQGSAIRFGQSFGISALHESPPA